MTAKNQNRMTIGALACAAGVNVETIRFYQRRGLMTQPERPQGGIRRYTNEDMSRLAFIKSAQKLGFRLDEILQLLQLEDGANCAAISELARAHLLEVQQRLASLRRMETALSALVKKCSSVPGNGQVKCPLIKALHATSVSTL